MVRVWKKKEKWEVGYIFMSYIPPGRYCAGRQLKHCQVLMILSERLSLTSLICLENSY